MLTHTRLNGKPFQCRICQNPELKVYEHTCVMVLGVVQHKRTKRQVIGLLRLSKRGGLVFRYGLAANGR